MANLKLNLCLSDIPKDHIFTSEKTGKKYIDIDVVELKSPFDDGTDHTAYHYAKDRDPKKVYVGKAKTFDFTSGGNASTPAKVDSNDLPF